MKEFLDHFSLALRHIFFWSLPATILFIVLRAQIVRAVLGAGAFSWVDTRLTAAALLLLALSILSQGLLMLYIRAFYASGHTYLPVGINLVASLFTIFFAWWMLGLFKSSDYFRELFLSFLKVSDISASGVLILPLAISLGSIVNLLLLILYFRRSFMLKEVTPGIGRSFRDSLLASVVLGFITYYSLQILASVFDLNTFVGIFLQGFFSGILGIASGAAILSGLKNQEFAEFYDAFKDNVWKKLFVVTTEPEKLP